MQMLKKKNADVQIHPREWLLNKEWHKIKDDYDKTISLTNRQTGRFEKGRIEKSHLTARQAQTERFMFSS